MMTAPVLAFYSGRTLAILRTWALALYLTSVVTAAYGELIPTARLFNWQAGVNVGLTGGIPTNRKNIVDVTQAPYNADNTGVTDASAAINSAISAATGGSIVYLRAGTYRCNGVINLGQKSNITLRGAGPGLTTLKMYTGGQAAMYSAFDSEWPWNYNVGGADITAGFGQASSQITVSDPSTFSVGDVAVITEQNNYSLPVLHVSGPNGKDRDRLRGQMSRITGMSGSILTISPPLFWSMESNLGPKIRKLGGRTEGVGVEDLQIDMASSTSNFGIWMIQTYRSWVKNVTIINPSNYGIYLLNAFESEVRHCEIRDRKIGGSNGAGILLERSTAVLIEDNIFYKFFPHLEVNFMCSGNVFAYNFCHDSDVSGVIGVSINSNHGGHNQFNLYEGNISPKFQCDGYFGSSSDDTAYRNWFHGTSENSNQFGVCVFLNRFTRDYNLVGNILGRQGVAWEYGGSKGFGYSQHLIYALGLPNIGNGGFSGSAQLSAANPWSGWLISWPGASGFQELDRDVETTTIRKGNFNYATNSIPTSESLGSASLADSLFRTGKPSWFGGLTWPPFDPRSPGNPDYTAIPAGYRFVNGVDPGGGSDDQTAPSIPTSPVAAVVGATQIDVSWTASTDNLGVNGYRVQRSQGAGSTVYAEIAAASGTSFSDKGLTGSTVYNYRVRAVDAAGNSSGYSSVATGTTLASVLDNAAPSVPINVVATAIGAGRVSLAWTASTDNVGVTAYLVERSQAPDAATYIQVGTPSGTSFSDTGLTAMAAYNYRMRAQDFAGNLSGYSAVVPVTTGNGLVAAYDFEEGAGNSVPDASGNGNSGTISGATRTSLGKVGRALDFNGVDNVVVVNSSPSLNLSSAMTLEAWVCPTISQSRWRAVLHKEPDAYYLHASSAAGSMLPAGGGVFNGTERYIADSASLPLNTWTYLATTYDGTMLRLYVNGSEISKQALTGPISSTVSPLRIGGSSYPNCCFKGRIDEVRVYDRALSPAEIRTDMNTPVAAQAAVAPPTNVKFSTGTQ